MQPLNSNIPQSARTAKYSSKKAQDLVNLVLFCCVAFSYYKDVCVARNSCVYLRFRVFYFLFFRFLLFVSELFSFRSDKRFQIFFYVPVFDSAFQSRIFSAINNNLFRDFSVSEFRAFQFLFINQMSVLFFRLSGKKSPSIS